MSQAPGYEPAGQRTGFLDLMRNRNYALLWSGQLVSKLGDWIHIIALLWWIQTRTGSTLANSLVLGASILGLLVAGPIAGALADRLPRKRLLIGADLARAILVLLIPAAVPLHLGFVLALVFLVKVGTAIFEASLFSSIPQIVERRALGAANAYYSTMDGIMDVAGTLAAGVILKLAGPAAAFYIDSGTYVVSLATVVFIALPATAAAGALSLRAIAGDIAEGARYVRRDPSLWPLVVVVAATSLTAPFDAQLTTLAQGVFRVDERLFSFLFAMGPLGIIAGSWALPRLARAGVRTATLAGAARAVVVLLLAVSPNPLVAMPLVFLYGVATVVWLVSVRTEIMAASSPQMLGRSLAAVGFVNRSIPILAMLALGRLADDAGVRVSFATEGAIGLLGLALAAAAISTRGIGGSVRALVAGRVSEQFDPDQQQALNVFLTAIVLALWTRLALAWPVHAAGLAAVAAAGYVAASAVRAGR